MRWIDRLIKRVGVDKVIHFLVGGWILIVFDSLMAVAVIGILKELWDENSYGGFDFIDFLYTFAGGVTMLLLTMIL